MTAPTDSLRIAQRARARGHAGALLGRLAAAYQRVERTERGYVWLHRIGPAYLFGAVAALKVVGLVDHLGATPAEPMPRAVLSLVHQALSAAFFALIAYLFLIRRRPVRRLASPWQGVIALGGAYVMLPVALSPPTVTDLALLSAANLLMLVGTAGTMYALGTLGACFAIMPEVRGLVTHGPYRLVRHPAYLFEFIAFLGVALLTPSLPTVALYALFVGLQLGRIRFEEEQLARAFPEEYPRYCQRTARLIPGLY